MKKSATRRCLHIIRIKPKTSGLFFIELSDHDVRPRYSAYFFKCIFYHCDFVVIYMSTTIAVCIKKCQNVF